MKPVRPAPLRSSPAPHRPRPAYPTRLELGFSALAASTAAAVLPGCDLLGPLVAPLFEHGSGYASFGCKAVAPAAYLSEEQALEILREELAEVGLSLEGPERCSSYTSQVISHHDCGGGWEVTGVARLDPLDGCTSADGIGVEMVTTGDFAELAVKRGDCWASVVGRDYQAMARWVRTGVAAGAGGSHVGVFYEPSDTALGSEEQLRLQVRDFVAWLQEKGAL
jgi:hypothetical protein